MIILFKVVSQEFPSIMIGYHHHPTDLNESYLHVNVIMTQARVSE